MKQVWINLAKEFLATLPKNELGTWNLTAAKMPKVQVLCKVKSYKPSGEITQKTVFFTLPIETEFGIVSLTSYVTHTSKFGWNIKGRVLNPDFSTNKAFYQVFKNFLHYYKQEL